MPYNNVKSAKQLIIVVYRQQLARFLVIGLINTTFSYGIYAILISLGLHFTLATMFQILLSIGFNYLTFGNLVFGKACKGTLLRFILVCAIQYVIYTAGIWGLTDGGISSYLAGAIMIIPVVVLSYLLNKNFAFKSKGSA